MPKAGLRQQVVGLGLDGRSESNDCGEKQHLDRPWQFANPNDKRVVHQKRDLIRNLWKPGGNVYTLPRTCAAGMDLFVRPGIAGR
jgi:hypothetical protein